MYSAATVDSVRLICRRLIWLRLWPMFSTSFAPMFRFLQRICSSIRFGCSDFVQPQLSDSEFISVLWKR
jgi:hypothetical protein